jgi:SAM-dependent methyltransferase
MFLYASTVAVSAFLLFLIQPIIAKQILPWFGGTAAVWTTCLVFFQLALLAGYFYSDWLTRKVPPRRQALIHLTLVVVAAALLPIIPSTAWKPQGTETPSLRILLLLSATIGLPYFLLSTTSPLVQAWFARSYPGASPYRLFALSNAASMVALLGYPVLIEPWITTRAQAFSWSAGFAVFAILVAASAYKARQNAATGARNAEPTFVTPAPTMKEKGLWAALSAMGSTLLLALSNHLTQNIASVPLLWVLPLALYLLTFIVCFAVRRDGTTWYQRKWFVPMLAIVLLSMAWTSIDASLQLRLYWQVALCSLGLLITCMFCHGELVAARPAPEHLTTFYLMTSIGGALGAVLVGLIAPMLLPAYFDLEIALVLLSALASYLLWSSPRLRRPLLGVSTVVVAATIFKMYQFHEDSVVMKRNFYGSLRVQQFDPPIEMRRRRVFIHGSIAHGDQYLDSPDNAVATTYYKLNSGIGRALSLKTTLNQERGLGALRVGVIGLGVGTLAAYGHKGDMYRFYDIDPAVVEIARRDFTYLRNSPAEIQIAVGDARLNLEKESPQNFDVLAVDAFSGNAIPMHLLTLEVMHVYERHVKADGIIAFHVSNHFLNLKPVVRSIAEARGLYVAWVRERLANGATNSDWVLVCRDREILQQPSISEATSVILAKPARQVWTDDFNNLLEVLN